MKTYFITGVNGFIGIHWAKDLLSKGNKVIGIDNNSENIYLLKQYKKFFFFKGDILKYRNLKKIISKSDIVIHLASIAEPLKYINSTKEVIDVTALASIEIINICSKLNKSIFFTSTSEIYGKNSNLPFKEEDDRVLGSSSIKRWCYSTSKALVEHYLEAAASSNNRFKFKAVRLFNIYGSHLKGRVVPRFIEAALKNKPIEVNGTGKQTRCFTYIKDAVSAFNKIINSKKCNNNFFNVGDNKEISIEKFANVVIKLTKSKSKIRKISYEKKFQNDYEDMQRRVPNIKKIYKFTKWKPTTSLEKGILLTISNHF